MLVNKDCIEKRIEVFGFSKEKISDYTDSFLFELDNVSNNSSINMSNQLKEYLHSHPNIHNMVTCLSIQL